LSGSLQRLLPNLSCIGRAKMEILPDLLNETLTLISFCNVLRRYLDAMDPAKPHDRAAVLSVLAVFPELAERRKQLAGSLSGGQ
jgi:hypothetical protein